MRHLLVLTLSLSAGPRGDRPALWKALWVSLCCWLEEKGGVQTDVSVSTFSPRKLFEKDVSGTILNAFYKFSSNCWPIFFFINVMQTFPFFLSFGLCASHGVGIWCWAWMDHCVLNNVDMTPGHSACMPIHCTFTKGQLLGVTATCVCWITGCVCCVGGCGCSLTSRSDGERHETIFLMLFGLRHIQTSPS